MLKKIKTINFRSYVNYLRDVRSLGLAAFAVIVLLVTWSGINVIQTNYELQKKISSLEQEVNLGELENSNRKLRNEYLQSDDYLELQARRQFGKAAPGEKLLVIPRAVALSHSVAPLPETGGEAKQPPAKPFYQRNFEAWTAFLFRRS